jgi:hypothetical protein
MQNQPLNSFSKETYFYRSFKEIYDSISFEKLEESRKGGFNGYQLKELNRIYCDLTNCQWYRYEVEKYVHRKYSYNKCTYVNKILVELKKNDPTLVLPPIVPTKAKLITLSPLTIDKLFESRESRKGYNTNELREYLRKLFNIDPPIGNKHNKSYFVDLILLELNKNNETPEQASKRLK